jgi:hypothetical protein
LLGIPPNISKKPSQLETESMDFQLACPTSGDSNKDRTHMVALLRLFGRWPVFVPVGLAIVLLLGCSTESGQIKSTDPTLLAAQNRLVRAEKLTLGDDTQAA